MTASTLKTCQYCGAMNRLPDESRSASCGRCDSKIHQPGNIRTTLALTLAALILYIPANLFPILQMTQLGAYSEATIISGVSTLFANDMWGVAAVVFAASILVPLLKILGLLFLCWVTRYGKQHRAIGLNVFKVVHLTGPWSMLDVFVVAVLVSLVKLGELATITPGPGVVAFAGMVVLTLLASQNFDTRLMWAPHHKPQED